MKAILEFNLPEDKEEFDTASRGNGLGITCLGHRPVYPKQDQI